ncbi:MAG TPA: hypothetical protein VJ180_11320 [Pyrinomonadaceae bacterium]|nr:hypothetical protein [Pyrinomonadaceae bacterium]
MDGRPVTNFTRVIAGIRCPALRPRLLPTLALVSFVFSTSCRSQSAGASPPLPVQVLVRQYEESRAEVRRKYDGHEITVRGYTSSAPTMPRNGADQGSVLLEEKEIRQPRHVACWFTKDQSEQFSQVRGNQYLIVKGVFNGEADAQLKFCKLVKVE